MLIDKKIGEQFLLFKMKKLFTAVFITQIIISPLYAIDNEPEGNTKSINFDQIIAPNYKKVKFRITTIANKENVHLEFEAMKLSGGQYAVFKAKNCDSKNFSSDKLKKLGSKDLFFSFTTQSGNIFEERKIDFKTASKFNIGIYSFVLVKIGNRKSAIVCFSQ